MIPMKLIARQTACTLVIYSLKILKTMRANIMGLKFTDVYTIESGAYLRDNVMQVIKQNPTIPLNFK